MVFKRVLKNVVDPLIRRRRTALSVSCPCLVFVRIFQKILSGVCLLSGFCPDFLSGVCLSVFYLSRFCPLSGLCSDFKGKGCLVSVCPDFFYLDFVRCRDFVWIFISDFPTSRFFPTTRIPDMDTGTDKPRTVSSVELSNLSSSYPLSEFSWQICSVSVRCPDSVRNFVKNPVRCLSGWTRTRQSCPDFRCPCPPTSAPYTLLKVAVAKSFNVKKCM